MGLVLLLHFEASIVVAGLKVNQLRLSNLSSEVENYYLRVLCPVVITHPQVQRMGFRIAAQEVGVACLEGRETKRKRRS